jgi:hypothetical protein
MAQVVTKYLVRMLEHKKKIADKLVFNTGSVDQMTKIRFGDGGKTGVGELIVPNGNNPVLGNQLLEIDITRTDRVTDYEYISYGVIDTSVHTALVGKDINERAIMDAGGTMVVMETFAGFGVLQANKTYEYALRYTII